MTNALRKAVAEVESLPEADQEHIGRQVMNHVQKLRALRADIDAGIRSLDGGKGYVIFYRIMNNAVEILRVLDERRDVDTIFSDEE
jgi:plasmid stabilization system protein ParE